MGGRVAVYVPNLDGGARLLVTLGALANQTHAADIVVVDNASRDDSVACVREAFPEVRLIELRENVGFGRALNLGVREHPADRLVFVNNDVECEPTFVEALLERLGLGVGMVAGVLLQRERPRVIDSAGTAVDQTLLPFDYLYGEPLEAADAAAPPLGPTGGAALYTRDAFSDVGGFDERFFAYLEDVDLALRMRTCGFACALAPAARGVHHHSATLGAGSSAKNRLMGWGRGYMLRRYGVLADAHLAVRALAVEAAICAGQAVVDRNAAGVAGRIAGWRVAKGLDRRARPHDGVLRLQLRDALRVRARRRPRLARLSGGF
jgi:GT2 family glycosyltransferase